MSEPDAQEFLPRWLPGWAASRHLRIERAPHLLARVGDRHRETERFAGPGDDPGPLFAAVAGDPRAMLTFIGHDSYPPPPPVRLGADGESAMTVSLVTLPTRPHGFQVSEEVGADSFAVSFRDGAALAAVGQLGVSGTDAVFDKIETAPEYRRRGLASAIMSALTGHAFERGCTAGLLIASVEGRPLYAGLGWTVRAPVVSYFGA